MRPLPESSPAWKAAVLAELRNRESPEVPQVNEYESPVVGLSPPAERLRGVWSATDLWFPTPKLKDRFPTLARFNGQFQRWLRRYPLVLDGSVRERFCEYPDQMIGFSGFVIKVFALPHAVAHLQNGGFFAHNLTTEKQFEDFISRMKLRGIEIGSGC